MPAPDAPSTPHPGRIQGQKDVGWWWKGRESVTSAQRGSKALLGGSERQCGGDEKVGACGGVDDLQGQPLRNAIIDGEPWFVAADACRRLGWPIGAAHGGSAKHLRGLDPDEKRTVRRAEEPILPLFAHTQASAVTLISRPGLFKLIQRSNKPQAKEFDRWVRTRCCPKSWSPAAIWRCSQACRRRSSTGHGRRGRNGRRPSPN